MFLLALALLAGLLQAASIAAPWSGQPAWWLQLLSLAVLAWLAQQAPSWRRAGLLGWTFATAWLAGTFWWLFISMHVYGGLPAPLAAFAVLALAAFLATYYGAACAVFALVRGSTRLPGALAFAALWLLAELLRVTWFTGFPWGAGGYAHVDGPLSFLAPQVGVHG
ncbi:MAG TPA: apolipoprotein N-acyltransferase, partial [Ramlibacter sp.]